MEKFTDIKLIHLSDLHFRKDWEEDQEVVLEAFFQDLEEQIKEIDKSNIFLVFSGDVVHSGSNAELYEMFIDQFEYNLDKIGIKKSNRFCIPGNHDVSRSVINESIVDHEAIINQKLNEYSFNDYINKPSKVFIDKFNNYLDFESRFAKFGINKSISGFGWNINDNIGVYCLNTAIYSSGGTIYQGKVIDDKCRLAIDTRSLTKWLKNNNAPVKILIMHHPSDWLIDWAQTEIKTILKNKFSLCLSGHVHDQSLYHFINNDSSLIECSAPPLLTNKHGDLGYAIISVNENGVSEIIYRQWTKHRSFRAGVNFSNTDSGKVEIQKKNTIKPLLANSDVIGRYQCNRLDQTLRSFSSQPLIWVDPILSKSSNLPNSIQDNIDISEIVSKPAYSVIKAPPQFGLTSLAHYLIKRAWSESSSFWFYLDYEKCKVHKIREEIESDLQLFGLCFEDIKCIIIDSWTGKEKESIKFIEKTFSIFKNIPIIIMQTIDDSEFFNQLNIKIFEIEFNNLYLLPLTRSQIRKIVADYNEIRPISEDDIILRRVVSDLEALNLHRTPLNCLTLLKVSEVDFEESPVNRSEMIRRVLFLLFNMDDIPTYKEKPDLKDCEYVLGRFCELLIRENQYMFTMERFLQVLKLFCKERVIELEVQTVFDILYFNNIIISRQNYFCFRFTYWVYYFAAQRMIQDQTFANYIFENRRYASFPEIIEFYTGIDRSREDALRVLIKDIDKSYEIVYTNIGIPDGVNPYLSAKWKVSKENVEKIKNEITDGVLTSNLPDGVKDQFADRSYDTKKPYYQDINNILQESSLIYLFQTIRAGSRALRNSDYVNPDIKYQLLDVIMKSWEQVLKVLLVISPILSMTGNIKYDGMKFILIGELPTTVVGRFNAILHALPSNIVTWFTKDLFSRKMGLLLLSHAKVEKNEMRKHHLMLLLINERPKGWRHVIEHYIESSNKNSFFLSDVLSALLTQYQYSYATEKTIYDLKVLIKMTLAKHEFNSTREKAVQKISSIYSLPKREIKKPTE